MKKYLLSFGLLAVVLPVIAGANEDLVGAFRSYKDYTAAGIVVPTVVEVPIDQGVSGRGSFLIVSQATGSEPLPYLFRQTQTRDFTLNVLATGGSNAQAMIDGNQSSFGDFPLPVDHSGSARITINSSKPQTPN